MRNRKLTVTVASACTLGLLSGLGVTALIGSASAASPKAKYQINLTGAKEFPGPGDPNGTGTAKVTVKGKSSQVCVIIKNVANVALPSTGAHIHSGTSTQAGPIVIPLAQVTAKPVKPGKDPKPGKSKTCATVSAPTLSGLLNQPSNWYVNVHSSEFPGGAVRSQLSG